MVRIISGVDKGRRLKVPAGLRVRPTSDRAKESLFNMVRTRIEGCRFLDLFSGTGSVGLEAASRGAEKVFFVESDPGVIRILNENIRRCGVSDRVRVMTMSSRRCVAHLASRGELFDLIFLDPPYRDDAAYDLIRQVQGVGLLSPGGLLIAEHDRHDVLPGHYGMLRKVRRKQVGDTVFSFYGDSDDEDFA